MTGTRGRSPIGSCHGYLLYLTIGSCLAFVYQVMDAHGKSGEHEGFLSATQTSQVHP